MPAQKCTPALRSNGGDWMRGWDLPQDLSHPAPPSLPSFAEVLDLTPDAIMLLGASGSVVYANQCVGQLFGVGPDSILGQPIETLIPDYDRHTADRFTCDSVPYLRPMRDGRMILMGRHADGRNFPIDVHLAPIERGGQRWTLAVVRDATEQHRTLDEVRAAKRAAEEVARLKGEFLGFAAHDLSQPVQTLELLVNGIGPCTAQSPEVAELAALATNSLTRMRELLKMLLEISRVESGTLQVHWQPVQVAEIFDYLEQQFGPIARAKALAFVSESCGYIVEADPALLRGLLSNLVANAIRYTPGGEVRLHSMTSADGRLCLAVRDTGIGIQSEQFQKIFEDFARLETAERTAGEGFGLGLGIARRLSTLLGFPITVQSTVGRGSTFGIEIPAAKVLRAAEAG